MDKLEEENTMRIPIIKVRDGECEHIVGTNSHDVLYVDKESGGIQFLNIQCCEVAKKHDGEQTMQFVGESGYFEDIQIQFVTVEELIELALQNMENGTEQKLKLHQMMREYLKAKDKCREKLEEEYISDTSSALLF